MRHIMSVHDIMNIVSVLESEEKELRDIIIDIRNDINSYFKRKFQQIDFQFSLSHITKEILASGKIFIENLSDASFNQNQEISYAFAKKLRKKLKNFDFVPVSEGILIEVSSRNNVHSALSYTYMTNIALNIIVSPPQNRITNLKNNYLSVDVRFGSLYSLFISNENDIDDYFEAESSHKEKVEAVNALRITIKSLIDEVTRAIRLSEVTT